MSTNTLVIAELMSRGIGLQPTEAVAVVQQLIHRPDDDSHARPPFGPPSPDNIEIRSDGTIVCTGCDATPSVSELAILLQQLLSATPHVPGGLQYAVGRALHEVEGPPFDSLDEFSAALARHEHGDRHSIVRGLAERAGLDVAPADGSNGLVPMIERRSTPPIVTELRRQLREADRALFECETRSKPKGITIGSWSPHVRVPAIVSGVAAGVIVSLAAETIHVTRTRRAEPSAVVVSTASPTDPISQPVEPVKAIAPIDVTKAQTTPAPVAVKRQMVSTRTPNAPRSKRSVTARRAQGQKAKHRRFLGIPFFSD